MVVSAAHKIMRTVRSGKRRLLRPAIVEIAGVALPVGDPLISERIRKRIYRARYEAPELEVIRQRLSADDVVLELGTGIGFLAAWAERCIGKRGRVHTIEADPALEPVIRRTFALNRVSPELIIGCAAVTEGRGVFYREGDCYASSCIRRSTTAEPIQVPIVDAGEIIKRVRPSFLVVDIEGTEVDLLPSLPLEMVKKICIELHPHIVGNGRTSQLLSVLIAKGFVADFSVSRATVWYFERTQKEDENRGLQSV
jgi:FkbM family methyltransferase